MHLLLLFRPSAGSGNQTVTHTAGILALAGGTHTVQYGGTVTHTIGPLALSGGTHTVNYGGSVTHTAGILVLSGGTHQPDNGEEVIQRELPKMGVGI